MHVGPAVPCFITFIWHLSVELYVCKYWQNKNMIWPYGLHSITVLPSISLAGRQLVIASSCPSTWQHWFPAIQICLVPSPPSQLLLTQYTCCLCCCSSWRWLVSSGHPQTLCFFTSSSSCLFLSPRALFPLVIFGSCCLYLFGEHRIHMKLIQSSLGWLPKCLFTYAWEIMHLPQFNHFLTSAIPSFSHRHEKMRAAGFFTALFRSAWHRISFTVLCETARHLATHL